MIVLLDTNIIISAALFPNGVTAQAFFKAISEPFVPIMCDYVVDELHRKFNEKFPHCLTELENFLLNASLFIKLVPTPKDIIEAEKLIRDPKDRPILRAALNAHADFLLTGDKDFLESSITEPKIISVQDFLNL